MRREKILVKALVVLLGLFLLSLSTSIVWAGPPAPVEKTGQTTKYATGDDGYYEKGVAWPNPRFTDNGDQTVTDNLTGLMWTKNAEFLGGMTWTKAIKACETLELGQNGCNLYTDWRLPNSNELASLIDKSNYYPALPSGHPFYNVRIDYYWTSTTDPQFDDGGTFAWRVHMSIGRMDAHSKASGNYYVWPVRGGND